MPIKKEPKFIPGGPLFTYDGLQVVKFKQRYQHFNATETGAISPEEAKDLLDPNRNKQGAAAEHPTDPALYERAQREWRAKAGRVALEEVKLRKLRAAEQKAHADALAELEAIDAAEAEAEKKSKGKGEPPEK